MKYEVVGGGDFHKEFENMGFPKVEIVKQISSVGDCDYIVSETGYKWFLASRENNYPKTGFTYSISKDDLFKGTANKALKKVYNMIDSMNCNPLGSSII